MANATYPASENAYPNYGSSGGGGGAPSGDFVKDGGVDKISAGTSEPTSPAANDLWIDTDN